MKKNRVEVVRFFMCKQTDFYFTRNKRVFFVPNCFADDFIEGLKAIGVEVVELKGENK